MSEEDRFKLADAFERYSFEDQQDVVCQGEDGDGFYVIEAGEAVVTRDGQVVSHLNADDYFGELALLNEGNKRAATVTASGPLKVAKLPVEKFNMLLPESLLSVLREKAVAYTPTKSTA